MTGIFRQAGKLSVLPVLILAGLMLRPMDAVAVEPSYDEYVAEVKAGKTDIDYAAFRMAYAAGPRYEPYGPIMLQAGQMRQTYAAGDCTEALAQARQVIDLNFVQIDAHMVMANCLKRAGKDEEAQRERTIFVELIKSILKSGDGKTPESAFVVIAVAEEYSLLSALGLVRVRQALVNYNGSAFDRIEAKARDSDQAVTLFFNVDRLQAQLARARENTGKEKP